MKTHTNLESFNSLDNRMRENLNKLQKTITEIKQNKYERDLQDYRSDSVYQLKRFPGSNTPKSILKKANKTKQKKVDGKS